jgi:hypothetical protein
MVSGNRNGTTSLGQSIVRTDQMATATIYAHPVDYLSWSSSSSVTSLTENSTTVVTNSSGATVYWTEGANSGSINNGNNLTCTRGAANKKWNFSESSGGTVRITLTVSGGGT